MGGYMDFMGRFEWVNSYGKKQCTSLFRRAKAAIRKAVKSRSKRQLKFQYDPSSYALNFDDGANAVDFARFHDCSEYENDIVWVYVLRVKSFSSFRPQPILWYMLVHIYLNEEKLQ
ncbi:hypothetical protein V6N11_047139 [Hibiscus sabdariffa]|uniref:Uncharacterized protein n=2 Tax=Hibiscus sabdariffa TaxID=183260 RepID=A0ABR2A5C3_9ROSI